MITAATARILAQQFPSQVVDTVFTAVYNEITKSAKAGKFSTILIVSPDYLVIYNYTIIPQLLLQGYTAVLGNSSDITIGWV